jgi:MFS superfamily sulfate permease-like transporter
MLLIVRSLKAGVVVALVATALGVDLWQIVLVSVLWSVLSSVEDRYSAKAQIAAIDEAFTDEVDGWTPEADDPTHEEKGDISRIRLPENERIVVYRIADAVRRMTIAGLTGVR